MVFPAKLVHVVFCVCQRYPLPNANEVLMVPSKLLLAKHFIHKPLGSLGVILAGDSNPIINLTYDNVMVLRSIIPSDLDTHLYALDQSITDKYINGIIISFYKVAITCALLLPLSFLGRGSLYNGLDTGAQQFGRKMTSTD